MADRPWYARGRLRWAMVAAVAGVVAAAERARASDEAHLVALEWVAPEGCPDGAYVEREVKRLLGDGSAADGPYLQARARLREEKPGLWHIELRTMGRDGAGIRTVTAESCPALADAAALILALTIDPERVAANRSTTTSAPPASAHPSPGDKATRGPPAAAAPPTASPPFSPGAPRSASPGPIRFAVAASGVVDTGTLPDATPGFAARLAGIPAALAFLRFELGASLFVDDATANPPSRSGTFSLRTFDAGACLVTHVTAWGRPELGACASGEVAWLSAAGLHETVPLQKDAAWGVLRARATVAYPLSAAWAVRADLGAGLDVSRPEFVSAGAEQGPIHRPARYTGRGALGLELRF